MSVISFRTRSRAVAVRWPRIDQWLRAGRGITGPRALTDIALAVFCVAMLIAMELAPGKETIPYHFLFLALTLVYGFRVWPLPNTLLTALAVTVATGWVMVRHHLSGDIEGAELAEVPLMPLLFIAMVWHARRRVAAQREVERMADQRRAVLDREREFFRDASHAIRTPVTIARGHLELLEGAFSDPEQREDLGIAVRQLDRMSALSNRLLALARLDAGDAVRCRPLNLSAFLDRVGRNWSSSADRGWIIDCPPTGTVLADPEWLELALDALIENAVHFTSTDGLIRLACRRTGTRCVIEIADSGPGISADDLPHVFERFWHRRSPTGAMGSGLGLPMARAAVEAQGGSLMAGTAIDGGACFSLSFPRYGGPDGERNLLAPS
jgi:signal transduction histidine kinase